MTSHNIQKLTQNEQGPKSKGYNYKTLQIKNKVNLSDFGLVMDIQHQQTQARKEKKRVYGNSS